MPNELKTAEQYRHIIDALGVMSDGQHHPHVHIMFSERLIDEVEKKKERDAKNFFLYPAQNKKDGSEPSFGEKWKLSLLAFLVVSLYV